MYHQCGVSFECVSRHIFAPFRDCECFDADAGKDSAREIREYFVPDFSNWKNHDSYAVAIRAAGTGLENASRWAR